MSEYQYYEFQALDRPLTAAEQQELRAISTRARITPASFTNTYEWGDLSGSPRRMTERYFDAHLYVANWGTHRLILRLPQCALPPATVKPYCLDDHIETWTFRKHTLLDLTSDDEDGEWVEGAEGSLAALVGLREELAAGDLRSLYLGWLSALAAWELEEDDEEEYQTCPEPPVPAGLGDLTAAQRALADFLRVDDDLLAAAAAASTAAPTKQPGPTKKELAPLVAALPSKEKDALLLRVALGPEPGLSGELLRRLRPAEPSAAASTTRSAADLLDSAHQLRNARRQRVAREAATARAEHLTRLAQDAESEWQRVEALIEAKKPGAYDQAVTLLKELRDAHAHTGRDDAFRRRLAGIRAQSQRLPALRQRLNQHGLR